MPIIKVPLIAEEVPQEITWLPGTNSAGELTAQILVQSLMTTTLLALDRDSALALRNGLDEIFDFMKPSLEIVREMPKQGEPVGPLGPFRA